MSSLSRIVLHDLYVLHALHFLYVLNVLIVLHVLHVLYVLHVLFLNIMFYHYKVISCFIKFIYSNIVLYNKCVFLGNELCINSK